MSAVVHTDIQADLAVRFKLPCGIKDTRPDLHKDNPDRGDWGDEVCLNCQGSGVRYPFRLACPECERVPGFRDECGACNGLGYVFNPDADVLWEAVRAKVWVMAVDQGKGSQGDMVFVWSLREDGSYDERIGFVSNGSLVIPDSGKDEGLRGQAALQTALHRAMEETDRG